MLALATGNGEAAYRQKAAGVSGTYRTEVRSVAGKWGLGVGLDQHP